MKKIKNDLEKIIKNILGSVIYIGNDNDNLKALANNNKITYCDVLNGTNMTGTKKKGKNKKSDTLNIRDFKKYYGKKNIDYIICDINEMVKFIPRFIPISLYICDNKLCFYGNKEVYDLELLCKKYKRYGCDIKVTEYINDYVIEIDMTKTKNKFFRDKYYYIIDNIRAFNDKISDSIVS